MMKTPTPLRLILPIDWFQTLVPVVLAGAAGFAFGGWRWAFGAAFTLLAARGEMSP